MLRCFILFYLTFLLSPTQSLFAIDVQQFGPGYTGTLSPLVEDPQLELVSEHVVIYLHDDHAEIEAKFFLKNSRTVQQKEMAGLPSISVSQNSFKVTRIKHDTGSLTLLPKEEPLDVKIDYHNTVPLVDQFDVKRVWHAGPILIPAQKQVELVMTYDVPYLYKKENLRGRTEESKRLFIYTRKYAGQWKNKITRSIIYVRPRVSQPLHLTFNPKTRLDEHNAFVYEFDGQDSTKSPDLIIEYDPLHFSVHNGVAGSDKPPVKPANEFETYEYANLFDGRIETAWCEGEGRAGLKNGFEVEWGKNKTIHILTIYPGKGQRGRGFEDFNRLKKALVYFGKPGWQSSPMVLDFANMAKAQSFPIQSKEQATLMGIQIVDVYFGRKENTTCVGEIEVKLK